MITVVVGPPCAGKSTFVSENAADGDVIVDFDAIARALGASGHRPDGAIRDAAFAARDAVIKRILETPDADAWIIHTSPQAESVAAYREAGAVFEVIDPGMDVCLARAEADGRPDGTVETIRSWYESPPDFAENVSEATEKVSGFFHARKEGAMKIKSAPMSVKAGPDDDLAEGEFVVYASTFTREPDSYGDVVAKGAFAESIEAWKQSGNTLPGLFGHRMDDPDFYVASAKEIVEDDHGLRIRGEFDLESPKGSQVYRLVKGRRLNQLSFAYEVLDEGQVVLEDGRKANELRKLHIHEFSFVPIGANQDTSVVAVKALADALVDAKAGRVLAQKHIDSLRAAQDAIGAVIAAAEETNDQEKEASVPVDAKPGASDEEPVVVKSSVPGEELKRGPSVADLATQWNIYATAYVGQEGA